MFLVQIPHFVLLMLSSAVVVVVVVVVSLASFSAFSSGSWS